MTCPYCGQQIVSAHKEHFFPKAIVRSSWDFWACDTCNRIKNQRIVYPHPHIFKVYPGNNVYSKFMELWGLAGWEKYLYIVPHKQIRESFMARKWLYGNYEYDSEESHFYRLEYLKKEYRALRTLYASVSDLQAIVVCPGHKTIYLLSRVYCKPFLLENNIYVMSLDDYASRGISGWLLFGSASRGVWKITTNYKDYFNRLLGD